LEHECSNDGFSSAKIHKNTKKYAYIDKNVISPPPQAEAERLHEDQLMV
jgi:hypothetical protein